MFICLFGCKEKEEISINLDDIDNIIQNHLDINEMDDNYVDHYIDKNEGVIVIELLDISDKKQEEFIYNVFSRHSGSKYIKYIKEHSLLSFKESN